MAIENTLEIEIEGEVYQLRTRLPWMEQKRIDDLGWRMFVDGRELSKAQDFSSLEEVEIKTDSARQDHARLVARLVGVRRRDIADLNPGHVAVLLDKIGELEAEAAAEVKAIRQGNPTAKPSDN